ncbi:hypothetical protein TNCV_932351 [Trichonephila clavipes]|nr:hypothetical protein TNCV_932351 [Trichonephila clavipes]
MKISVVWKLVLHRLRRDERPSGLNLGLRKCDAPPPATDISEFRLSICPQSGWKNAASALFPEAGINCKQSPKWLFIVWNPPGDFRLHRPLLGEVRQMFRNRSRRRTREDNHAGDVDLTLAADKYLSSSHFVPEGVEHDNASSLKSLPSRNRLVESLP